VLSHLSKNLEGFAPEQLHCKTRLYSVDFVMKMKLSLEYSWYKNLIITDSVLILDQIQQVFLREW